MRKIRLVVGLLTLSFLVSGSAHAQFMMIGGSATVAIKSGETLDLGQVYWVSQCRSLLKETPTVEVLDGPPQISASIKEAMVVPRWQGCAKGVNGGILQVSAKDIDDPSFTHLTLRIHYKTRDGDRRRGAVINLQLVP